jgi:hypothetical protein
MSFFGSRNSIIGFTVITALVHLGLGFSFGDNLFLLNGVGYLALMYAFLWTPSFLAGQKSLVRWVFIGYTALTIVLYFVISDPITSPVGLATKLVEALLIFSIWRSSN